MESRNVLGSSGKGLWLRTNPTIVGYVVAGVVTIDMLGGFWEKGDTPGFLSTQQAICERSHCEQLSLRSGFRTPGTVSLFSGYCYQIRTRVRDIKECSTHAMIGLN